MVNQKYFLTDLIIRYGSIVEYQTLTKTTIIRKQPKLKGDRSRFNMIYPACISPSNPLAQFESREALTWM